MLTAATSSSIDVAAKPFSRTAASATSRMRSRVSVPLRRESSWTASVIRKRLYHESSRPGRSTLLLPPGRILLPSNPLDTPAVYPVRTPSPFALLGSCTMGLLEAHRFSIHVLHARV